MWIMVAGELKVKQLLKSQADQLAVPITVASGQRRSNHGAVVVARRLLRVTEAASSTTVSGAIG